jgi:hypothetical protein
VDELVEEDGAELVAVEAGGDAGRDDQARAEETDKGGAEVRGAGDEQRGSAESDVAAALFEELEGLVIAKGLECAGEESEAYRGGEEPEE